MRPYGKAPGMTSSKVVVGVNDSATGRAALLWASIWARVTGADLRAVHVRTRRIAALAGREGQVASVSTDESAELEKQEITELFSRLPPAPSWTLEFVEGAVADKLVECSVGADLLVTGIRHPATGEVGCSIGRYCIEQASCPVVTVPVAQHKQSVRDQRSAPVRVNGC